MAQNRNSQVTPKTEVHRLLNLSTAIMAVREHLTELEAYPVHAGRRRVLLECMSVYFRKLLTDKARVNSRLLFAIAKENNEELTLYSMPELAANNAIIKTSPLIYSNLFVTVTKENNEQNEVILEDLLNHNVLFYDSQFYSFSQIIHNYANNEGSHSSEKLPKHFLKILMNEQCMSVLVKLFVQLSRLIVHFGDKTIKEYYHARIDDPGIRSVLVEYYESFYFDSLKHTLFLSRAISTGDHPIFSIFSDGKPGFAISVIVTPYAFGTRNSILHMTNNEYRLRVYIEAFKLYFAIEDKLKGKKYSCCASIERGYFIDCPEGVPCPVYFLFECAYTEDGITLSIAANGIVESVTKYKVVGMKAFFDGLYTIGADESFDCETDMLLYQVKIYSKTLSFSQKHDLMKELVAYPLSDVSNANSVPFLGQGTYLPSSAFPRGARFTGMQCLIQAPKADMTEKVGVV